MPRPPGVGVGFGLYLKMTYELTLGMNKIFCKAFNIWCIKNWTKLNNVLLLCFFGLIFYASDVTCVVSLIVNSSIISTWIVKINNSVNSSKLKLDCWKCYLKTIKLSHLFSARFTQTADKITRKLVEEEIPSHDEHKRQAKNSSKTIL